MGSPSGVNPTPSAAAAAADVTSVDRTVTPTAGVNLPSSLPPDSQSTPVGRRMPQLPHGSPESTQLRADADPFIMDKPPASKDRGGGDGSGPHGSTAAIILPTPIQADRQAALARCLVVQPFHDWFEFTQLRAEADRVTIDQPPASDDRGGGDSKGGDGPPPNAPSTPFLDQPSTNGGSPGGAPAAPSQRESTPTPPPPNVRGKDLSSRSRWGGLSLSSWRIARMAFAALYVFGQPSAVLLPLTVQRGECVADFTVSSHRRHLAYC